MQKTSNRKVLLITDSSYNKLNFIYQYFIGVEYNETSIHNPNGYVCEHFISQQSSIWVATYPVQSIGHKYHEVYLDRNIEYPDDYEKHLEKYLCVKGDSKIEYI